MRVGVIVLAAGGSARMGSPKQLLSYRGQTLLRRAAETALGSIGERVVVVIGSHAQRMREELDGLPVSVVENRDWRTGMSSSIRAGLEELASIDPDGVVLMLCDQPFVTVELIDSLVVTQRQTGKLIVASSYEDVRGVPAFFSRELFPELMSLTADEGARRLIQNHPALVASINFPEASIDIDTPPKYQQLTMMTVF